MPVNLTPAVRNIPRRLVNRVKKSNPQSYCKFFIDEWRCVGDGCSHPRSGAKEQLDCAPSVFEPRDLGVRVVARVTIDSGRPQSH